MILPPSANQRSRCAGPNAVHPQRYRDIDEQASQLAGHNQSYQQMSRGTFEGKYTTVGLGDDCWLGIEEQNQTLLQHGSVPSGSISFFILLTEGSRCRFQGSDFTSNDLAVLPSSSSFSLLCPAAADNCMIVLNADELDGYPEERALSRAAHRLQARDMRTTVNTVRKIARSSPAALMENSVPGEYLRQRLISTLATCLVGAEWERIPGERAMFQRACALIHSSLAEITIAELCDRLGVSRRTLEFAFRRELNLGPSAYIRTLRLNNIRRALAARVEGDSIADVAARWGLWHPSRFAQMYARLFGELPSTTRQRCDIH